MNTMVDNNKFDLAIIRSIKMNADHPYQMAIS